VPEIQVIVDAGPLVAFLNQHDEHHAWALEQFERLPAPFASCEAVLTETFHLLRRAAAGPLRLFDLLETGVVTLDFRVADEFGPLAALMRKYRDQPMSLADACLVRLAEQHRQARVFTVDSDFTVYRKHARQKIPTIMPQQS
jgi:uncharacterized protein